MLIVLILGERCAAKPKSGFGNRSLSWVACDDRFVVAEGCHSGRPHPVKGLKGSDINKQCSKLVPVH